jgi:isopenicillin-N N-acyltransferase-like protein
MHAYADSHYLRDISLRIINEVYLPGIKKYFPEALPELQGIADGAGVDLDEILFLNARYDLARVRGATIRPHPSPIPTPAATAAQAVNGYVIQNGLDNNASRDEPADNQELQECTSAGFLAESMENGDVILSQNWDMSANVFLKDTALYLEIHPDPSEDLPVMFVTTEAGQLGRSGFNSAGLGVCASSLMSTEDYFPLDLNLPPDSDRQQPLLPMSLVRRQFLHNINFANALINVKNAPRHLSNKLIVGTADNFIMSMEITPSTVHLGYPSNGDNFVVGSNHFISESFLAGQWNDRYPGGSSWFRAVRVAQRIRPFNNKQLTAEKITEAFCDHLSLPSSVCQHMEDCTVKNVPDYPYKGAQTTLAHIRYNLTKRTATVCKGPPCIGTFNEYSLPVTSNCELVLLEIGMAFQVSQILIVSLQKKEWLSKR